MRILAVIDSFGVGGAETQLSQTLESLTKRGHECIACSVEVPRSTEVEFSTNIERIYLGKNSTFTAARALVALISAIRRVSPDVVYSRLPLAGSLARLATWTTNTHHVAGIDTMPEAIDTAFGTNSIGGLLYRSLQLLADRIVCVSHSVAAAVLRTWVNPNRVLVVENGIDTLHFTPASVKPENPEPVVVCVSALRPEKGVPRLVDLMARVVKHHPARLRLVGDGVDRPAVEQAVIRAGAPGFVDFLGVRSDVVSLLQSSDIYASAAYVEGFGIAVAEAAAVGLPTVAFDVPGGLREVVINGKTGYLVQPDQEDAFVDAVVRLCRDTSARAEMGASGRKHVASRFSLTLIVPKLEAALSQWP